MKLPKLNQKGFGLHALLPLLVIGIVSVIGVYMLTASRAAVVSDGGGGGFINGQIYTGGYTGYAAGGGFSSILSQPTNNFIDNSSNMSFDGKWLAYFTTRTWDGAFFQGTLYKSTVINGSLANTTAIASLPSNMHALTPPIWSPDGAKVALALSGASGGNLWIARTDGTYSHVVPNVTSNGYVVQNVGWLPGSANIVYIPYATSASGNKICTISTGGANNSCHSITLGTVPIINPIPNVSLAVSPTDNKVAMIAPSYSSTGGLIANIYSVNIDGSGLKRLTAFAAGQDAVSVVWSPDGSKIAYLEQDQSKGPGSTAGLYVMNAIDGSKKTLLSTQANYPPSLSWSVIGGK